MKDYAKIPSIRERLAIKEKINQKIVDDAVLILSGFFACVFFIVIFLP
jgi:hypothetical protein